MHNMKKITTILLTATAFLLMASAVTAQPMIEPVEDESLPPSPAQARDQVGRPDNMPDAQNPNQGDEARIQIQQTNEIQNGAQEGQLLREQALNRVAQVHARRVQRRFNFYNQRLSIIANKLQSRLQALAAEGQDVSAAQEKLEEALQMIEIGMAQAQEATDQLNEVDLEQFPEQRQSALQAREQIQEARTNFLTAVELMREAVQAAITASFDAVE